jgi:hypothetical protein
MSTELDTVDIFSFDSLTIFSLLNIIALWLYDSYQSYTHIFFFIFYASNGTKINVLQVEVTRSLQVYVDMKHINLFEL